MARKRGELIPIGEVVSGLDDELVPAIRDDSRQARRSFTVADQVNQLISASEADPDLGFMARMMVLCSLPRTNPGNRIRYIRQNGPSPPPTPQVVYGVPTVTAQNRTLSVVSRTP